MLHLKMPLGEPVVVFDAEGHPLTITANARPDTPPWGIVLSFDGDKAAFRVEDPRRGKVLMSGHEPPRLIPEPADGPG